MSNKLDFDIRMTSFALNKDLHDELEVHISKTGLRKTTALRNAVDYYLDQFRNDSESTNGDELIHDDEDTEEKELMDHVIAA